MANSSFCRSGSPHIASLLALLYRAGPICFALLGSPVGCCIFHRLLVLAAATPQL